MIGIDDENIDYDDDHIKMSYYIDWARDKPRSYYVDQSCITRAYGEISRTYLYRKLTFSCDRMKTIHK